MQNYLFRNLSNIPGWRTDRKIVVIESDDWGSIRMPSCEVFNTLKNKGIDLTSQGAERYNRFDSLATTKDFQALFDCLSSVKDQYGNHPVFTAVSIVANPDFKKIQESNFTKYHFEPFTETLKRYPGCENSFSMWQEGIGRGFIIPEFHGREHLNVSVWMKALSEGERDVRLAFDLGCWGIVRKKGYVSLQAAFDVENTEDIEEHKTILIEGLELFKEIFGEKAKYFVPPNGPINNILNETAANHGVIYRSTAKLQREPIGNGRYRTVYHYLGQKNKYGQFYLTRNAFFEPSDRRKDWVDSCMNDIKIAFKWNKPAIISSHRVNYVGSLCPENTVNGIRQLELLLLCIIKKWPDVEFMSSTKLGELISKV